MNKKDIGDIAEMVDSIGATVATIADGLEGDVGRALLLMADLLNEAADDLRQAVGEEAGTR